MKRLLILRHAKSSWHDERLSDHDRPLNERGLLDAPRVGLELAESKRVPDLILCSTAARAVETSRKLAEACGYTGEIELHREMYLAPPETYRRLIAELPESVKRPLLVGHNPGLEQLVAELTGKEVSFPTAGLVEVGWKLASWDACSQSPRGTQLARWSPKHGWEA
jgi:phosphohistidine phosphatase